MSFPGEVRQSAERFKYVRTQSSWGVRENLMEKICLKHELKIKKGLGSLKGKGRKSQKKVFISNDTNMGNSGKCLAITERWKFFAAEGSCNAEYGIQLVRNVDWAITRFWELPFIRGDVSCGPGIVSYRALFLLSMSFKSPDARIPGRV